MSIKPTDKKARANYKKKVVPLRIELYPTDKDILEWLAQLDEPKATYVKRLIREDMEQQQAEAEQDRLRKIEANIITMFVNDEEKKKTFIEQYTKKNKS